ncbi:glycosyltransferase family 87 protein [Lysobacter changpingensis]|uniref:glycosyltransferase family 87 protein n=1 Tax=Lysobacter changpingensis TaxID=2792784 RepID=UPI001A90B598|nr:glycosyltransferase family 87 protein [Lysobacter changpingensis]
MVQAMDRARAHPIDDAASLRLPREATAATVIAILASLWIFCAGKDASWDVFNHHYYIPFAWMTGRIDADFFGAGPQSYQNPLGYLPFYVLVSAGLPSWVVGLLLGLLHALAIYFVWRITGALWTHERKAVLWRTLATALAAVSPSFLMTLGTSSADPISAVLVLGGIWCLVSLNGRRSPWIAIAAGTLIGLAFAIKLSNAIFVAAAGAMAIWQTARGRLPVASLLLCAMGGAVGVAAGMGWHAWVLWEHFGNPVFPFANNIFHSPHVSTQPLMARRFMPDSPLQWISRLWEMASMRRYVYQETFAPDIRPALALMVTLGGVLIAVHRLVRRRTQATSNHVSRWSGADADLAVFCIVAYVGWLATSGNGRYALALLMLMGLWLARACYLVMPDKLARSLALIVIPLQLAHFVSGQDVRIAAEPWTNASYLPVEVPEKLADTPYLHLVVGGSQTNASLAAFFHRNGALINPIGQMSLPMHGANGDQLKRRFERWKGRTRLLFPAFPAVSKQDRLRNAVAVMIRRLGFTVDWSDCVQVRYRAATAPDDSSYWWIHQKFLPGKLDRQLTSCALIAAPILPTTIDPMNEKAERVFALLERECPLVYGPSPPVTERAPNAWERLYANTDTVVVVSPTKGVLASRERVLSIRYLGTIDEVLEGRGDLQCKLWPLSTPE